MSDHVHTVASDVSQRPSGYGAWPLTGSCAAQMRTQGLSGVSLTLNEPFHGGYPYMAAMINYMIAHFLRAPEASGGSPTRLRTWPAEVGHSVRRTDGHGNAREMPRGRRPRGGGRARGRAKGRPKVRQSAKTYPS